MKHYCEIILNLGVFFYDISISIFGGHFFSEADLYVQSWT